VNIHLSLLEIPALLNKSLVFERWWFYHCVYSQGIYGYFKAILRLRFKLLTSVEIYTLNKQFLLKPIYKYLILKGNSRNSRR